MYINSYILSCQEGTSQKSRTEAQEERTGEQATGKGYNYRVREDHHRNHRVREDHHRIHRVREDYHRIHRVRKDHHRIHRVREDYHKGRPS